MHELPITEPKPGLIRYSDLDAQREYVACSELGIGFAASGPRGEWIYNQRGIVTVISPLMNETWVCSKIEWIQDAQRRINILITRSTK